MKTPLKIWLINQGDEVSWCDIPSPSQEALSTDSVGYIREDKHHKLLIKLLMSSGIGFARITGAEFKDDELDIIGGVLAFGEVAIDDDFMGDAVELVERLFTCTLEVKTPDGGLVVPLFRTLQFINGVLSGNTNPVYTDTINKIY